MPRSFLKNSISRVKDLVPLAAHTILTAGRIDGARIKALQILRCTKDQFTFVPSEEISELDESPCFLSIVIII